MGVYRDMSSWVCVKEEIGLDSGLGEGIDQSDYQKVLPILHSDQSQDQQVEEFWTYVAERRQ